MVTFSLGIRKKIVLGFYLLLFLMIGTTIFAAAIIREAEEKVISMEVIDDFLQTTLEIRRFEKNYFLYKEESSFLENRHFLADLEGFFLRNQPLLATVLDQDPSLQLSQSLATYKNAMILLHQINSGQAPSYNRADHELLEETIRQAGKKLTDIAEQTARTERMAIKKLLETSSRVLFFSMLVVIIIGIIIATYLGRGVVRSLKVFEELTRNISRGDFISSPINVKDEEIITLLQAFNRMTNELRTRQRQLVQSEKLASLGTLLSGVAHELNNPLSNISSSAQILAEEIEDDDIAFKNNLVAQIVQQSERAGDIVRTLLEFSRAGDFNLATFNLKKLVDETNILIRGQTPSQIDINVEIDPAIEVVADKQRLQQVFINLVKNAIDALNNKGNIWISAEKATREGARSEVEIMIEDDGPGIPEEIRSKIFDPFFTTKDVGHGSGLGLYIVHDIITSLNGSIHIDSRPGEGTIFIIWLPGGEEHTL